jgi:hypothetical protein
VQTQKIICRSQVRAIEDVVDAWKADHECAMKVHDIEDIIRVGVFVREQFRGWVADLWECASTGQTSNPVAEGETILHWFAEARKVMGLVSAQIAWATSQGYTVDNAQEFATALDDVRKMEEDFRSRWPLPDAQQVAQARKEFASGAFQSAEDVLRELQGANPDQH